MTPERENLDDMRDTDREMQVQPKCTTDKSWDCVLRASDSFNFEQDTF